MFRTLIHSLMWGVLLTLSLAGFQPAIPPPAPHDSVAPGKAHFVVGTLLASDWKE